MSNEQEYCTANIYTCSCEACQFIKENGWDAYWSQQEGVEDNYDPYDTNYLDPNE